MRLFTSLMLAAALHAQPSPDPAGHWKGAITLPGRQVHFEIDLLKNQDGSFTGFVALVDEDLKGIPLKLTVDGNSIKFHAREDQPFDGVISADATAIDGEYTIQGNILPFHMSRTGEPVAVKIPIGVAVPAAAEGEWRGTLEAGGASMKLILILANVPGGSAARAINLDEGGLELPVTVRQSDPELSIAITGSATWSGAFTGTELIGAWHEKGKSAPLNFRR